MITRERISDPWGRLIAAVSLHAVGQPSILYTPRDILHRELKSKVQQVM